MSSTRDVLLDLVEFLRMRDKIPLSSAMAWKGLLEDDQTEKRLEMLEKDSHPWQPVIPAAQATEMFNALQQENMQQARRIEELERQVTELLQSDRCST